MGVEALRTRMLLPSPSACFTLFSRQGEELSQSARSKGFSCDEWEAIDPVARPSRHGAGHWSHPSRTGERRFVCITHAFVLEE
jgi:hypothetical protein